MRNAIILLLVFQVGFANGQVEKNFTPFPIQDTIPPAIHQALKLRLQRDKEKITAKGKVNAYMKTLYDQRFDYLVKSFNEDYFMMNDDLTRYLQSVLNKIYDANPGLPRETNVFTFRSESPNAMIFGEGTLCVMLGLLPKMETEDVVAFVLCHELAHYYAGHSEKRMEELADLNFDRKLKKEIDAIMRSPYGQYSKMKSLFSSLDISINKHSREKEHEADSLGLIYFLKTGYNKLAPLRCMEILDKVDSTGFKKNIDFKKYFNFKEFPFKDAWGSYTKSDVWHAPPPADSSKTHPDCKKRFSRLQQQLGITKVDSLALRAGKSITPIRNLASFELIHSLYHFKQYGKALYHALILAEKFPDNAYAHAMISKCLYQLHKAQKDHELEKSLEFPDPRFEENYDRLLTFIHKLRLYEIANIAYYYSTSQQESFYKNEEFMHALWMCSKLEVSKVDPQKVREEYESLYPKGKYLQEMKKY